MLGPLFATALVTASLPADTTVPLGIAVRDLTGDNVPDTLRLTGRGRTIDSLEVTFTITSSGRTVYEKKWAITRVVGFDAGRRVLSPAEHRRRLSELGGFFFADVKFMTPEQFVTRLHGSAPRHVSLIPDVIARDGAASSAPQLWDEMRTSGITVFEFSTGGDAVTTIGWSRTDQRFYRLLECC